MQPDLAKIKHIIFDLGGVIIDLDEGATSRAFANLFNKSEEEIIAFSQEAFFKAYEIGEIDDPTFRAKIREEFEFTGSEDQIDAAWNAMLGKIDKDKIDLLERLSEQYELYVMSNTNDIHMRFFNRVFEHMSGGRRFYTFFKEVYYSQEIGERKPNPGAWQVILNDHQLTAAECLFIDDKLKNTEAAAQLGIQTYQNQRPRDWMALFQTN